VSDLDHATLVSNGTDSAAGCDELQHPSTVHPALYFFVFAQLLVGFGGCAMFVLTMPYIDENAPRNKSALYIGIVTFYPADFKQFTGCFLSLSLQCQRASRNCDHANLYG